MARTWVVVFWKEKIAQPCPGQARRGCAQRSGERTDAVPPALAHPPQTPLQSNRLPEKHTPSQPTWVLFPLQTLHLSMTAAPPQTPRQSLRLPLKHTPSHPCGWVRVRAGRRERSLGPESGTCPAALLLSFYERTMSRPLPPHTLQMSRVACPPQTPWQSNSTPLKQRPSQPIALPSPPQTPAARRRGWRARRGGVGGATARAGGAVGPRRCGAGGAGGRRTARVGHGVAPTDPLAVAREAREAHPVATLVTPEPPADAAHVDRGPAAADPAAVHDLP